MKKIVLVIGGLIALSTQAASPRDVRLTVAQVKTGSGLPVSALNSVVVYSNGDVVTINCPLRGTTRLAGMCVVKKVKELTSYEIDKIDGLIEDARDGEQVTTPPRARCFVAPSTMDRFTADNDKVFLRSGHICLDTTVNTTNAATKLVQKLVDLRAAALTPPAAN